MPRDARALHCPNCGSPAAPGDAACKYLSRGAGHGQLPRLFRADVRGGGLLPVLRRAARAGVGRAGPGAVPVVPRRDARRPGRRHGAARMRALPRRVGRREDVRARVRQPRSAGGGAAPVAACPASRRHRTDPLPQVRRLRKDDEPPQLRPALGHRRRRVQGPRHVPRRRRAARDRVVHRGRRPRSRAPAADRGVERGTAAPRSDAGAIDIPSAATSMCHGA